MSFFYIKVKLKDISMEIFLPTKLEALINKSYSITQKVLDATKAKSPKKTNHKNSFLEKLNAYNSQDSQQPTRIIDNFSSIHRLEVILKKSQTVVLDRLFDIDLIRRNNKRSSEQVVGFLKLKILLSYFENFEKQLKTLLAGFVGDYDMRYFKQEKVDIFEICLGNLLHIKVFKQI